MKNPWSGWSRDILATDEIGYVVDSSSLIKAFSNYQRSVFPTFWKKFDDYVEKGRLVSVREARQEMENGNDRLSEWVKAQGKNFFGEPDGAELAFVEKIFANKHFRGLVARKAILAGYPVADPFLIAKAKISGRDLITEDGFFKDGRMKENAPSPAWVCHNLGIGCVNLDGFMKREGWRF